MFFWQHQIQKIMAKLITCTLNDWVRHGKTALQNFPSYVFAATNIA
jgi:hypothetical protein